MEYLTQYDAKKIWNEMDYHSWDGFRKLMEKYRDEDQGLSQYLVRQLLNEYYYRLRNEPFPYSAEALFQQLTRNTSSQATV